jgi:hypothetical protein
MCKVNVVTETQSTWEKSKEGLAPGYWSEFQSRALKMKGLTKGRSR